MTTPKNLTEFQRHLHEAYQAGRIAGLTDGGQRGAQQIRVFCERIGLDEQAFYHLADASRTIGTLERAELYDWKFKVKKINAMVAVTKQNSPQWNEVPPTINQESS